MKRKLKDLEFNEIGSFRNENGYAIISDIEFGNGIEEPRGTDLREKVWYTCKDGQIMLKTNTDYNENAAYSELISCELANQSGIETAEYDMVMINGKKGIITKNMCKPGEELVSINELIGSGEVNEDYPDSTDIYYVFDALEEKFLEMEMTIEAINKLLIELKKRMLFDLCVMETDRHVENISFIFSSDENGERQVRLAPMYDTEAALCLYADNMEKIYSNYNKVSDTANMQEPKISVIPEGVEDSPVTIDLTNPNAFLLSLQSKVSQSYYTSTSEEMWKSTLDFLCEEPDVSKYYSEVLSKMDIKKAHRALETKIGVQLPECIKKMSEACFESRRNEISWELDLDYEQPENVKSSEEVELT